MGKTLGLDLRTGQIRVYRTEPKTRRVWMYQWPGEEEQTFEKEKGFWYYNNPRKSGFGDTGCDTLSGAKGDVLYGGGKVFCKTVPND